MTKQKRLRPIDRERIIILLSHGYPPYIADQLVRQCSMITPKLKRSSFHDRNLERYFRYRLSKTA